MSRAQDADDPYDLARFVAAQEEVYATALAELSAGRKRTHWMWFVLPQLEGLGSSFMAQRYAEPRRPGTRALHRKPGQRAPGQAQSTLTRSR